MSEVNPDKKKKDASSSTLSRRTLSKVETEWTNDAVTCTYKYNAACYLIEKLFLMWLSLYINLELFHSFLHNAFVRI